MDAIPQEGLGHEAPVALVPGGPPLEKDFSLGVPFAYSPSLSQEPRIGAVVHLYHHELAADFARILRNLGPAAQVMITTDTVAKSEAIRAAFAEWAPDSVQIRLVGNRGRDVAPKLTAFTDRFRDFDLLLFVHAKVSHPRWRDNLIAGLVGSDSVVRSVRALFEAEPRTGMVFCQHHEPMRPWTGWTYNFPLAQQLAGKWGLTLNRSGIMDFPSGSMFWARPAALQPILDLGLTARDFPPEPLGHDGSIAHAIERLFALACELAGYTWYKIAPPEFYEYRDTIVTPASETELRNFLSQHERWLLMTMTVVSQTANTASSAE